MGRFAIPLNKDDDLKEILQCAKINLQLALEDIEAGRKPPRYIVGMAKDLTEKAYEIIDD